MIENINDIIFRNKDKELEDFIELSGERFCFYFKSKFKEYPILERVNDWKALTGLVKLALMGNIEICWHDEYIFPSGNIGTLADLAIEYEGGWELLNDCGLIDPLSKKRF